MGKETLLEEDYGEEEIEEELLPSASSGVTSLPVTVSVVLRSLALVPLWLSSNMRRCYEHQNGKCRNRSLAHFVPTCATPLRLLLLLFPPAVTVQLAYTESLMGKTDDAAATYARLLKAKYSDAPSMAVVTNNSIAARGASEMLDALKRIDKLLDKGSGQANSTKFQGALEFQLSAQQKRVLLLNRATLLLLTHKARSRSLRAATFHVPTRSFAVSSLHPSSTCVSQDD